MKWLFADWVGSKEHIFRPVRSALEALGHTVDAIPRSDDARRSELIAAIRDGTYDALLTWQRFYQGQATITAAIRESGIQTVYMDFGFQPHYASVVFDSDGENAASSWPKFWEHGGPTDLSDRDLEIAETLMKQESARARTIVVPDSPELQQFQFPFVFVPLQRPMDAVVRYDSSVHNFGELVRRCLLLARGSHYVVVKTHPLDRELDLAVPDRIYGSHTILRHSAGSENERLCDYLLSRASLVVGVNSNMLFRAIVFGTPVLATGRGWYSGSGALHEVDGVSDLSALRVPAPDLDAQRRYIATCLSRQLTFEELGDPSRLASVLMRIGIRLEAGAACG